MPANPCADTPIVDEDLLADDFRIPREPAHPVVVAEDDDGVTPVLLVVFRRVEDTADRRLHAEHREVVSRDELGLDALRLVVHADRGGNEPAANHFGQRLSPLLIVLIDRIRVHPRSHVVAVVGTLLVEHHQLVGACDRQLAEQQLIDQRENRGICADSQGSDRIATAANNGLRRSPRSARRRSPRMVIIVTAWTVQPSLWLLKKGRLSASTAM
jgi:hypothetical protein